MTKRAITVKVEGEQVTIERPGSEPLNFRDLMAVFTGHSGRLKIFGIGQTQEELQTAPLTNEEKLALQKCSFLHAFKAEDFSIIRFEAFLRYVFLNHLYAGAEQFSRPVVKLVAPELDALPPEQRREVNATLKKFGNPAYLNGRRIF